MILTDRFHIGIALAAALLVALVPASVDAGVQEDEETPEAAEDEPGAETSDDAEPDEAAGDAAGNPAAADETGAVVEQHAAQPPDAREGGTEDHVIHGRARLGVPREAAVKVSIKVIYASREGRSIDHRIRDLARGFQKEFRENALSKFVLLDSKEFKIGPGLTIPVDVPGGRRLKIQNGGIKGKQVVLGLEIEELIRTTVLLTTDGKFSFGGPKYRFGEGMIIIVVKARPAGK